jgi:hypothetical protein
MMPTGYIPSSPILALRSLSGGDRMAFPPPGLFSFARYALLYYLQYLSSLRRKPLERVLLPDYMCHEVAETLRSHGYDPHFYSLDPPFDVSIADLDRLLQQPVRWDAIVVAHFHGRVCRNLRQVTSWCAERGIVVIEDAVHLPYPYAAGAAGAPTDAALYTLRKVYPVPHGSTIVLREGQEAFARFVAARVPRHSGGARADFAGWFVKQLVPRSFAGPAAALQLRLRAGGPAPFRSGWRVRRRGPAQELSPIYGAFLHAEELGRGPGL